MKRAWAIVGASVVISCMTGCKKPPEPAGSTGATGSTASAAASLSPQEAASEVIRRAHAGVPGMNASAPAPTKDVGTGGPKSMTWTAPKQWSTAPNPNTFRKATFKVPGAAGDAELAVSESGGSLSDNIARWEKQFGGAKAKTDKIKVAGMDVTLVELRGTYTNAMGTGPNASPQAGSVMLGAIVNTETPHFFKLTGPEKTVDAAKPQWQEFVNSFKPGS